MLYGATSGTFMVPLYGAFTEPLADHAYNGILTSLQSLWQYVHLQTVLLILPLTVPIAMPFLCVSYVIPSRNS